VKPTTTIYRLVHGQRDLRALQAMARAQGVTRTFGWPSVCAERDGQLLGVLATTPSKKAVIAGPLVIAPGVARPIIMVIRLIEAYEVILKQAGVKAYCFHIQTDNPAWRQIVEEMGHEPFGQDDAGVWYERKVA